MTRGGFVLQGDQGSQGVNGPRGPAGEGLPGAKVGQGGTMVTNQPSNLPLYFLFVHCFGLTNTEQALKM